MIYALSFCFNKIVYHFTYKTKLVRHVINILFYEENFKSFLIYVVVFTYNWEGTFIIFLLLFLCICNYRWCLEINKMVL